MKGNEVKVAIIVCVTAVLVIAIVVGGICGNRWLRQQDTRELTEFSIAITVPPGFTCTQNIWMTEGNRMAGLVCRRNK